MVRPCRSASDPPDFDRDSVPHRYGAFVARRLQRDLAEYNSLVVLVPCSERGLWPEFILLVYMLDYLQKLRPLARAHDWLGSACR